MKPPSPDTGAQRKMGLTMIVLAWLVLLGLGVMFFNDWLTDQANPNQSPASARQDGSVEVTLLPNRQHHYVVTGHINGEPATLMLDTGATDVVVPGPMAERLGLTRGARQYANTANGRVAVYATTLDSVAIGDIHLNDIRASINPAMQQSMALLGMSALRQIEFTQSGDKLILRQ